ncbi:hypothetical protein [Aquipseudomonas ullengensis]|uniref:Uncharacterized protein n=1 Tax=Aquipseudomonas ullengensis TaxID=2759166 RepID=A0A7W4LKR7_9GAMM|nr:hypothetical protein [Pseudomonas ullengensis]MBB2495008.1 hypothetical protein [Pseudomonas ullengensis]
MRHALLLALSLICSTSFADDTVPRGVKVVPSNAVPGSPGRLIFSRDSNAPNACDVDIYVNLQRAASLGPGKSTMLDLPSGQISVSVALSSAGYCGGNGPGPSQSVLITPGETRQFAIKVQPGQVFLAPMLN